MDQITNISYLFSVNELMDLPLMFNNTIRISIILCLKAKNGHNMILDGHSRLAPDHLGACQTKIPPQESGENFEVRVRPVSDAHKTKVGLAPGTPRCCSLYIIKKVCCPRFVRLQ